MGVGGLCCCGGVLGGGGGGGVCLRKNAEVSTKTDMFHGLSKSTAKKEQEYELWSNVLDGIYAGLLSKPCL